MATQPINLSRDELPSDVVPVYASLYAGPFRPDLSRRRRRVQLRRGAGLITLTEEEAELLCDFLMATEVAECHYESVETVHCPDCRGFRTTWSEHIPAAT